VRPPSLVSLLVLFVGCGGLADLGGTGDSGPRRDGESFEATGPDGGDGARDASDAAIRVHDASHDVTSSESSVDTGTDAHLADAPQESRAPEDAARDATPEASTHDAAPPESCSDGIKHDGETDVDCGGGICVGCGPSKGCHVDGDCGGATVSGCNADAGGCFCDETSRTCVYSHCFDQVRDQGETGLDCGGGVCAQCAQGQGCAVDSDCVTDACDALSLLCIANLCLDHRQDGSETDVDCGGSDTCARCRPGQECLYRSDCQVGDVCVAADAGGMRCAIPLDGG
jgi:hypothetical protein